MLNFIRIRKGVNPRGSSFGDDVLQVKRVLDDLGYYKKPRYGITEYPDKDMFSGIRDFQKDNDLKIDGILKPNGETEKALDKAFKVSGRSPVIRCPICTRPHGGVYGPVCTDCLAK